MKLTPRSYQLAIFNSIMEHGNTFVILPTGLGKTLIALMLIKERMCIGKCLFLTPTKPLAKQHVKSIKDILELGDEDVAFVSGETKPEKRAEDYKKNVIVATPQTIKKDLEAERVKNDFSLCIFDEAHRAVGDYAYTYIAAVLRNKALLVGLSASPGGKKERINEVLENTYATNIEIRTHLDEDVKPYIQQTNINWIKVALSPGLKLIKDDLDGLASKHARMLAGMGFPPPLKHKGKFMALRQRILDIPHNIKYPALVQYSILLHVLHMAELLETQGVFALNRYIDKLSEKESKSAKALLRSPEMLEVMKYARTREEHPKLGILVDLIKKLDGKKCIVFAQYRDQIKKIVDELEKNDIKARQFVGKKDGVTRKMQEQTIEEFQQEKFDVLVASSIGEEGLDIPSVDVVVFYEPIPSEIRTIQRRGRAARFKKGDIYVLITKDTRDEYYYWSSFKKEKRMKQIVKEIQEKMGRKRMGKTGVHRPNLAKKLEGQTKIGHFV